MVLQAFVYGDSLRPQLVAVIVPDPDVRAAALGSREGLGHQPASAMWKPTCQGGGFQEHAGVVLLSRQMSTILQCKFKNMAWGGNRKVPALSTVSNRPSAIITIKCTCLMRVQGSCVNGAPYGVRT
eukprot:1162105-Pelagomonas_calceolata.AAC.4